MNGDPTALDSMGVWACDLTPCVVCDGTGYVDWEGPDSFGNYDAEECPECGGSGENPYYALDHDTTVKRAKEDTADVD